MTGLSVETMEFILLILSIGMLVLTYLYRRTKKDAYNVAFLLAALVQTEVMKSRARAISGFKRKPAPQLEPLDK
jgi:hypothetical protein